MKIYETGSSVRDRLLGNTIGPRTWVVVGVKPSEMPRKGFHQIGHDKTRYLHPKTGEIHSLARCDPWTSVGRPDTSFKPARSIEDDLAQRDFTFNALAIDENGTLIDPFGGAEDVRHGVLRHVGDSDRFRQDPVRLVRGARYRACWPDLETADTTRDLFESMVDDLADLEPTRLWPEIDKALLSQGATRFLEVLRIHDALRKVLPEVDALFGVTQRSAMRTRIDAGKHTLLAIRHVQNRTTDPAVRFAVMVQNIGKGTTPRKYWPDHPDHGKRGVVLIHALADRLALPERYRRLAILASRWNAAVHQASEIPAKTLLQLFEAADAFDSTVVLDGLLTACEADFQGENGSIAETYPQAQIVRRAFAAAALITRNNLRNEGYKPGKVLDSFLQRRRIEAIRRTGSRFAYVQNHSATEEPYIEIAAG